jgi:tripartite-type tricarboxylate transporter receptor subunit TctC
LRLPEIGRSWMPEIGETIMTRLLLLAIFVAVQAHSQTAAPMHLVVPFSVGGPTDIAARIIAPPLADAYKRAVIVENRVGATGAIGTEFVARSAPDGSTILFGTSSIMAASPALSAKLPYDSVRDFAPVSLVATIENILVVHPSVPANSVQELVAYAKANPNKLAYGSSGIGSTYHLGSELFASQTGIRYTHVPYKGQGPAAQDLIAGHIQLMFDAFNSALPNIKSGKVKALGIASLKRHPELPGLPTIAEQGVAGYETTIWLALFLPAATPRPVVERLSSETARVMAMADVAERLANLGMQPATNTPDELAAHLKAEIAKWSKVVRDAGIRPE